MNSRDGSSTKSVSLFNLGKQPARCTMVIWTHQYRMRVPGSWIARALEVRTFQNRPSISSLKVAIVISKSNRGMLMMPLMTRHKRLHIHCQRESLTMASREDRMATLLSLRTLACNRSRTCRTSSCAKLSLHRSTCPRCCRESSRSLRSEVVAPASPGLSSKCPRKAWKLLRNREF